MARRTAIVGVGQTFHRSRRPDVHIGELCAEAVKAALEDAEIHVRDIQAFVTGNMELFEGRYVQDMWLADWIGAVGKPGIRVTTGGTTGGTLASVAFELVASGLYDLVLAVGFEKQFEGDTRAGLKTVADPLWIRWQTTGAIGYFSRQARYYMKETGAPEEAGAMVRVRLAAHARNNPHAHLRLDLESVEEVLKSPYLIPPLRQLDMCPTSEGACAIVVASEERAARMARRPVWVKDWTSVHKEAIYVRGGRHSVADLEMAASRLFRRNGIQKPMEEISVAEIYAPSTWAELEWLEAYGFCEKGTAWRLEEKGVFYWNREFPVNPSGGVVCTNPIGATGLIRVAEVALQLRGDAGPRQISRKPTLGFSSAWGGSGWTVAHLLSSSKD
jgi:acetyl-CoA C-acetyltransferase